MRVKRYTIRNVQYAKCLVYKHATCPCYLVVQSFEKGRILPAILFLATGPECDAMRAQADLCKLFADKPDVKRVGD